MEIDLSQIWTAAGILVGFQVTSFAWRIAQEAQIADKGDLTWIPPADYLNLLSMVATVLGVFVAPVLGFADTAKAQMWFGLGAILFVGHSFALAGHYELFNPKTKRSYEYFPLQEKVVFFSVAILSIAYLGRWHGM